MSGYVIMPLQDMPSLRLWTTTVSGVVHIVTCGCMLPSLLLLVMRGYEWL